MRALWDNSRRWCDDQRAVSKLIRGSTESDISHAMIYVDDHWVTDATAEGVQSRNTLRLFFPDDCSVNVKRSLPIKEHHNEKPPKVGTVSSANYCEDRCQPWPFKPTY